MAIPLSLAGAYRVALKFLTKKDIDIQLIKDYLVDEFAVIELYDAIGDDLDDGFISCSTILDAAETMIESAEISGDLRLVQVPEHIEVNNIIGFSQGFTSAMTISKVIIKILEDVSEREEPITNHTTFEELGSEVSSIAWLCGECEKLINVKIDRKKAQKVKTIGSFVSLIMRSKSN